MHLSFSRRASVVLALALLFTLDVWVIAVVIWTALLLISASRRSAPVPDRRILPVRRVFTRRRLPRTTPIAPRERAG
jgi:endonuclease/exonuclease/phosphatase (EEP) superfamily protein YafD